MKKYEYLTDEHLGCRPDVIQKAKCEYYLLGKVFNKGLGESDKKEGLLNRLKNIKGKNKDQLDATEDQRKKNLKEIKKQEKQLQKIKNQKKELKQK